jgi:hypothetical protein
VEVPFTWKVFDDLRIWRYQKYVENSALSSEDAKE